jgi:hypothetical protein
MTGEGSVERRGGLRDATELELGQTDPVPGEGDEALVARALEEWQRPAVVDQGLDRAVHHPQGVPDAVLAHALAGDDALILEGEQRLAEVGQCSVELSEIAEVRGAVLENQRLHDRIAGLARLIVRLGVPLDRG